MTIVEQVSDLTKHNWTEVFDLKAGEFLSYAVLQKMKIIKHNQEVRKQMKQMRRK